jgi:3D (Asp-Asp-Asp) domain-containing protein
MKEKIQIVLVIVILAAWCAFIPAESKKKTEKKIVMVKKDSDSAISKKQEKVECLMVRTTYYNPVASQCGSNPLVTADGSKVDLKKLKKGDLKWLAISRDLLRKYPLGSKVRITSEKYPNLSGIYSVHDIMGPRSKHSIDILRHVSHECFGTHLTRMEKV